MNTLREIVKTVRAKIRVHLSIKKINWTGSIFRENKLISIITLDILFMKNLSLMRVSKAPKKVQIRVKKIVSQDLIS